MELRDFDEEIDKYLREINISLEKKQKEKLYFFMNMLIEKNKKINLTAIVEPKDVIIKHFVDSIIIGKYIDEEDSIIDIGTGAGFPGIPLKIVKKENKMLLIDSLNKRVNFIEEVIENLNLEKIEVKHFRAEEIGQNEVYREQFNIVISRAVAKLNVLLEYMLPFLKVGGKCICMKGPNVEDELRKATKAIEILGGRMERKEEYYLPNSDIKRTVIIIKKMKHTPNKYPRKTGMPTAKPIE